jgi:hypothetical protein
MRVRAAGLPGVVTPFRVLSLAELQRRHRVTTPSEALPARDLGTTWSAVKSCSALHGPEWSEHPGHEHHGSRLTCSQAMRCHVEPKPRSVAVDLVNGCLAPRAPRLRTPQIEQGLSTTTSLEHPDLRCRNVQSSQCRRSDREDH